MAAIRDTSVQEKANRKSNDVVQGQIKYPLWFGGSSSACAALVSHPLDLGMQLELPHNHCSCH